MAGAWNAKAGELIRAKSHGKNSLLFIHLLRKLHEPYPDAKKIHVILDNDSIHSTEEVAKTLAAAAGQRFALHFLPPYCPDHNKIKHTCQDFHASMTRNRKCSDMSQLMTKVRHYVKKRKKQKVQYANAV